MCESRSSEVLGYDRGMLIVMTTLPSLDQAEILASQAVESRLAACVQILPEITSVYAWDGRLMKETEYLLLIKTTAERWDELQAMISANHPYDVPEIAAIEASQVSEPYRKWLTTETTADPTAEA
jgi:periplasmic divalent cation tolerance protein